MFEIKSEVEFDMAHYLSDYNGKCSNIHGHRYRVVAILRDEKLKENGPLRGMVDDFTNLKNALKDICNYFDHKLLLENTDEGRAIEKSLRSIKPDFDIVITPYRTTAEEMARDIYNRLYSMNIPVFSVELFETPTNSCKYTGEKCLI